MLKYRLTSFFGLLRRLLGKDWGRGNHSGCPPLPPVGGKPRSQSLFQAIIAILRLLLPHLLIHIGTGLARFHARVENEIHAGTRLAAVL